MGDQRKKTIALTISNDHGDLTAGATAKIFGYWLLIENIWVSEELRGQNIGTQLLECLENEGIKQGCQYALLDTLNFQAHPFYEKFGYTVKWTQEHHPKEGCKYFMVKNLII